MPRLFEGMTAQRSRFHLVENCGDEGCPGHTTDYGRVEIFLTDDGESIVSWLVPYVPSVEDLHQSSLS